MSSAATLDNFVSEAQHFRIGPRRKLQQPDESLALPSINRGYRRCLLDEQHHPLADSRTMRGWPGTFFVGHFKRVGKVYLQTAIDCHSRYAWGRLYPNKLPVTAVHIMNNEILPTFDALHPVKYLPLRLAAVAYHRSPPRPTHSRARPKTSSTPLPLLAVSAAVSPHVPDRSTHPGTLDS